MPADEDIATILQTAGVGTIGTDLFWGAGLSDTPDTQLAVTVYGSAPPDLAMTATVGRAVTERPRIQIVARAAAVATAIASARAAWNALQNYAGAVNGTTYLFITCLQSPFFMGRDENNRKRVGFNVEAILAS